jgi:hypothetical protein
MNAGIFVGLLLVLIPVLSLLVAGSDLDDHDRRGWWPGVKAR